MKSTERPPETPPAAPTNAISEDRMLALARRFAELTAAQRTLFLQRLEGENIDFNLLPIPSRHAPHKADAAEGALPASYAQVRLWFLWRLEPDNPTYNLAGRLRLTGEINHAALAASVNALVARHESLRTTFSAGPDGAALQKVHPPAPLIITWRDCRAMSAAQLSSIRAR
ncbi:condensation domain-containing protein [Glaciimonas sp. GG7]